ncbi:hypothetical protein CEXT_606181 [Caerostris extrusa]|uniref:Uncharacterized protein n=1 Tax=Caerostris extrusa TaxID=172846 RepID=A0AAV4V1I8_CAEEX|nr:hypothetical protein CEXT_606181 [Caerostris extrusa]
MSALMFMYETIGHGYEIQLIKKMILSSLDSASYHDDHGNTAKSLTFFLFFFPSNYFIFLHNNSSFRLILFPPALIWIPKIRVVSKAHTQILPSRSCSLSLEDKQLSQTCHSVLLGYRQPSLNA